MKKILVLIFSLLTGFFSTGNLAAQEKAKTELTSVKQKGENIRFSLVSSRPFIYGNNRYILYIGQHEFTRNEQSKKNGKGYMTFIVPEPEFNNLKDGEPMYISYGQAGDQDKEEFAKTRKCWSLGKFRKSLLK